MLREKWKKAVSAATLAAVAAVSLAAFSAQQVAGTETGFKTSVPGIGLPGSRSHALATPLDACIYNGVDNSISVTEERFKMQIDALATALESDEFSYALKTLKRGRVGMYVSLFNYSATPVTPGWVMVDEKSRFELAAVIRKTPRPSPGYTQTHKLIEHALEQLQDCRSGRAVLDIMTDGKLNWPGCQPSPYNCQEGIPVAMQWRNEASARGVQINALVMPTEREPDVEQWAKNYLVTQTFREQARAGIPSARMPLQGFVLAFPNTSSSEVYKINFASYLKRKLVLEMTETDPAKWNDWYRQFRRTLPADSGENKRPDIKAP